MAEQPPFTWESLALRIADRAYRSESAEKSSSRTGPEDSLHLLERALGMGMEQVGSLMHYLEELLRKAPSRETENLLHHLLDRTRHALHKMDGGRDQISQAYRVQAERERTNSNRAQWLEEIAAEIERLPEVRALAYQSGSAQAALHLLAHDPEAPWAEVVRQRLKKGEPGIALSILLAPSRPEQTFEELRQESEQAIQETSRENPERILRLLEQGALAKLTSRAESLWRESWERLLVRDAVEALRALFRPAVSQGAQITPEDWTRSLSSAALQDLACAAETSTSGRVPQGIALSGTAWAAIFRHLTQERMDSRIKVFLKEFLPPADLRLRPEDIAPLLSTEDFSSEEKVRLMTLTGHLPTVLSTPAPSLPEALKERSRSG